MKKGLLLFAAGCALSASAQVSNGPILPLSSSSEMISVPAYTGGHEGKTVAPTTLGKTTSSSHSYWYSFQNLNYLTGTSATHFYSIYNDSTLYVPGGTPNPFYWYLQGLGTSFDPTSSTLNPANIANATATPPPYVIASTNAYTVDSIEIVGFYNRKSYNNYTDTLNIYVALAGGASNPTGTGMFSGKGAWYHDNLGITDSTIHFADMQYDSISNGIRTSVVPGVLKITKILDAAAFADSTPDGLHDWVFALPSTLNAAAGQKVMAYQQFISGNNYRFGMAIDSANLWEVLTYELQGANTFPHQNVKDYNAGLLMTSSGRYNINNQALFSGGKHWLNTTYTYGNTAGFDDPYFAFHVTCATCTLLDVPVTPGSVSGLNAYPNPAATELNVTFSLLAQHDATVSLSNVLGEVVATQKVKDARNGKTTFNIAALPSGVYFVSVTADGQRSTGRVTIAH